MTFFLSPGEAWDVMLAECAKATRSIHMEQYILMDDALGQHFLTLMIDKAVQGLDIRLMLDRVGSRTIFNSPLIRQLRECGGKVKFYNAVNWLNIFQPRTWFPRNHSKNLVIDEKIAFVGSVCFAEHMRHWRDTQVRFTGPVVTQVDCSQKKTCKNNLHYNPEGFDYVSIRPSLRRNVLYKELLNRIKHARHSIRLVTPYFLPPRRLIRTLAKAAERGVNVQIMLSRKSDVAIADYTSQSYFPQILRKGMRIFLYDKTVLHAKYMVIDEDWASVGSTNLDYLSLMRNCESNLVIYQAQAVETLLSHFTEDMTHCQEIGLDYYKTIPLHHRLIGRVGHIFRWVL